MLWAEQTIKRTSGDMDTTARSYTNRSGTRGSIRNVSIWSEVRDIGKVTNFFGIPWLQFESRNFQGSEGREVVVEVCIIYSDFYLHLDIFFVAKKPGGFFGTHRPIRRLRCDQMVSVTIMVSR